jgi:hypothetical protein
MKEYRGQAAHSLDCSTISQVQKYFTEKYLHGVGAYQILMGTATTKVPTCLLRS